MAQYKTGVVTINNGSNVVSGLVTQFLANITPGAMFRLPGAPVHYLVNTVDSDVQLTLNAAFGQDSVVNSAYSITKDFTPVMGIPEVRAGDSDVLAIITEAFRRIDTNAGLSGYAALDASSYSSLPVADAAAVALGQVLVISTQFNIPVAVTLNATIKVVPGGNFTGGGALNINGVFEGCDGCFVGIGSVVGLDEARPEWFRVNITPGTTDMASAFASASSALKSKSGVLLLRGVKYGMSVPYSPPSYITIRGMNKNTASTGSTSLYALAGFTGAGVIILTAAGDGSTGRGNTIERLNISVASRPGVHGIYASDAYQGPTQLNIQNVYVSSAGGSGVRLDCVWSSTFTDVIADNSADHNFMIGNSATNAPITTTMTNCYAKRTAEGKAGYRLVSGKYTLIGCNGVDPGGGTNYDWGVFGGRAADGDPLDVKAYITMIGCNIETFSRYGVWAKAGTIVNYHSNTWLAGSTGTVVAIRMDSLGGGSFYDAGNRIMTGGAAWANGYAVHVGVGGSVPPFIKFGVTDFTDVWQDSGTYTNAVSSGGFNSQQPNISTIPGNTGLRINGGLIISRFSGSTGDLIARHFSKTAAWAPGTLAATGFESRAVIIVNVDQSNMGDTVVVGYTGLLPNGVFITGSGSGDDNIKVQMINTTGVAQDIPAGTVRVDVWQH